MTPQERQLVDELFDRLAKLEGTARDAEATAAIRQGLSQAPNAIYPLVQTVLLQEEALKRAAARIEELEGGTPSQENQGGGFLDSMRGAIFGQQQRGGSVPSVRQSDNRPAWNTGAVLQNDPRSSPPPLDPRAQQGGGFGGGGSFLGTAAAAAAGVIGGSLLMNSIGGLMGGSGGQRQGFGDTGRGSEASNPWSGDQSKGDLAREAGLNDVGRDGGRDANADNSRQGFFDQASNEGHGGDEDYDSDDDFDSGDSDYA